MRKRNLPPTDFRQQLADRQRSREEKMARLQGKEPPPREYTGRKRRKGAWCTDYDALRRKIRSECAREIEIGGPFFGTAIDWARHWPDYQYENLFVTIDIPETTTANATNVLDTTAALRLGEAMALPLRRAVDYTGVARRALNVQPLPQGALPTYGDTE